MPGPTERRPGWLALGRGPPLRAGGMVVADYWSSAVLIGVLVTFNALCSGTEIALVSVRAGQLRQLERRDAAGVSALARLERDPNRFLATIQIGITLAGFLASA